MIASCQTTRDTRAITSDDGTDEKMPSRIFLTSDCEQQRAASNFSADPVTSDNCSAMAAMAVELLSSFLLTTQRIKHESKNINQSFWRI